MKHLSTFKEIYENNNSYTTDDMILISYKVPGTDKREILHVNIVKILRNNNYEVSFDVEGNPFRGQKNLVIKGSKIVGPYHKALDPYKPTWLTSTPVETDYSPAQTLGGGGISNDFVLPNS